jgi:hypothetical protein
MYAKLKNKKIKKRNFGFSENFGELQPASRSWEKYTVIHRD